MKFSIIIYIIVTIFLNACGDTHQFDEKPLKDILNSHTWYQVDESKDIYAIHRFSNGAYQKTNYDTSNFSNSINTIKGNIISYGTEKVAIDIDGSQYNCSFCGDEEGGYEILDCDAPNDILPSCDTIWKSKSLANAHKPN